MMVNQDEFIKTALRLPRGLHARVVEAAATSGRSMNAELIHCIELAYEEKSAVEDHQESAVQNGQIARSQIAMLKFVAHLGRQLLELHPELAIHFTKAELAQMHRILSGVIHSDDLAPQQMYELLLIIARLNQTEPTQGKKTPTRIS